MDPKKVNAVRDQPTPKNVKDVQSFTRFCNYYQRFIRDYSKIATPLYRFTKKGQPFQQDIPTEKSFQKLKRLILQEPILKTFDLEKEVIVETDASDFAIRARLYQIHDEKKHPVAFINKKLQDTETRYPIHNKELFAIVFAYEQWRTYLQGAKHQVKVYTDYKNLTQFLTTKKLNGRLIQWWEKLSTYNLKIIHTPGKENAQTNTLSRRNDYKRKETTCDVIL